MRARSLVLLLPLALVPLLGCPQPTETVATEGAPPPGSPPPGDPNAPPPGDPNAPPPGAPGDAASPPADPNVAQGNPPPADGPQPGGSPPAPFKPAGLASLVKDGKSVTISGTVTGLKVAQIDVTAVKTVDGQAAYWIRCGIAAGKAANLTAIPSTNSKKHEIVTPAGGYVARQNGIIDRIRLNDAAGTLHTGADVKFILMNYTTGEHSGALTFAQDVRTQVFTGLSLAVHTDDVLGVLVTQEDGTNEPTGCLLELGFTSTEA